VNLERQQHITFIGTNNLLCRRDVFSLVGPFDEHLFFYNEDLEWSWRAHKKGVLFYYRPDFAIVHGYGFADKPVVSVERQLARDIANAYVYKKHFPIIFPFVKWLAKRSLRHGLRRTGRAKLYSRLQRLLDLECADVVSGTYEVQKALLANGNLECLL
jgi:GT2 family glycosyltransferase